MKIKVIIGILAVVIIGLVIGLVTIKQNDAEVIAKRDSDLAYASNQLTELNTTLDDVKQKNLGLEKDIEARKEEITKLTNDLNVTTDNLNKTEAALKTQVEETAKRDARITELENQNNQLDKQAVDLKTSIGNLEGQIADTQKKLDQSEGDKAFLTKELNRLMAEKAELERQFNDLATLRTQVKKLKEELSISRRLEWLREGLFARQEEKGAQRLMQNGYGTTSTALPKAGVSNAPDLNVEVNSDGSVKVIAPITNTPPAVTTPVPTNPPPAGVK